jgi:hypothetical protein
MTAVLHPPAARPAGAAPDGLAAVLPAAAALAVALSVGAGIVPPP